MTTPEEIILLIVSLLGLFAGAFGVYDAWHDIRLLNLKDGRRMVARANLRAQSFRTTKLTLFVLVGALTVLTERPMPEPQRLIVVLALVIIAGMTATDAILDRLSRYRILRHYHSEAREEALRTGEMPLMKRDDL